MAGMTLSQMRNELILILGNRATDIISTARYNLWLNNSEIEIASAFQFFQTDKWVKRNTVDGTHTYALPSDCLGMYSLRDATNKRRIRRTGFRKVDNTDYLTEGLPTHYIRFGLDFQLIPTPDATYEIQLRYCKELTAMSADGDYPTLLSPWHECILMGAEWRGWRAIGEIKRAQLVKQEYIGLVRSRNSDWEIEDGDEDFGMEVVH